MKNLLLPLVLVISYFAFAGGDLAESSIQGYQKMLAQGEAIGVDVRSSVELKLFEAKGAKHIPIGDLEAQLTSLDKSKTYLVFCESGGRAGAALKTMKQAGFKKVINLKDWRNWRKVRDYQATSQSQKH